MKIVAVDALRVWDSRGRPTIEVRVEIEDGSTGQAIAPAGASTGSGEALDLRDGGSRLGGYDVQRALGNLRDTIAPALVGQEVEDQSGVDALLVQLDGTDSCRNLGGNTMIATSMALAHAAAAARREPLWQYFSDGSDGPIWMPVPEVQILGGGAHANGMMDLQDFMVVPFGASSFAEAMEWVAEVYLAAGSLLDAQGLRQGVADEGGYWPVFESNEAAIDMLLKSIEAAGFDPATQMGISLDIAASQFFRDGKYVLSRDKQALDTDEWFEHLASWLDSYPLSMIEDPFVEHDFESHARLAERFGDQMQIVGDDLLVTNSANVAKAAAHDSCNTLLCKPNQAGTLTRARAAADAALAQGWDVVVSARSGETEDVTITHLVTGWGMRQLKVGSFTRSERMAKWNELLRLERDLGARAAYAGAKVFSKFGKGPTAS